MTWKSVSIVHAVKSGVLRKKKKKVSGGENMFQGISESVGPGI